MAVAGTQRVGANRVIPNPNQRVVFICYSLTLSAAILAHKKGRAEPGLIHSGTARLCERFTHKGRQRQGTTVGIYCVVL